MDRRHPLERLHPNCSILALRGGPGYLVLNTKDSLFGLLKSHQHAGTVFYCTVHRFRVDGIPFEDEELTYWSAKARITKPHAEVSKNNNSMYNIRPTFILGDPHRYPSKLAWEEAIRLQSYRLEPMTDKLRGLCTDARLQHKNEENDDIVLTKQRWAENVALAIPPAPPPPAKPKKPRPPRKKNGPIELDF